MEQSNQESEISLKAIIIKVREYRKYLVSRWLTILLVGMLGAALGFLYSYLSKPKYIAELTFVLEESKSNPLGNFAGLASQVGIDIGGGESSGVFSGDNILEFLRSRLMVEKTLLSVAVINNKPQTLADYYIEIYKLRDGWKKRQDLANLHFPINVTRNKFTLEQDSILQKIQDAIVKKCLTIEKPDKKLSFISVQCSSRDEMFSKVFTERLVKEATAFYVETKTKRSKATVDLLQSKADSVEALLNKKTYSVAASQDLNLNPARSMAGVGTELVTRDKIVLQTIYAEVVKNLELSRMSMAKETPLIQVVDVPILPLEKVRFGRISGIVLGGFLGGFLIVLFLIIRRMYKNIIS